MAVRALATVDCTIPEKDLQVTPTLLGEGALAAVHTAKWRGASVAVKFIRSDRFSRKKSQADELTRELRKEACIASQLLHPAIVRLYGVYAAGTHHVGLVMELMTISLHDRVLQDPALSTPCITHVLHDVASALAYLHSRQPGIIHRDVSPRNILLSEDSAHQRLVAKLADFTTAKVVENIGFDQHSSTSGVIGTLAYLPREAIDKDPVTEKLVYSSAVDLFSVGAVGLFAILRKQPGYTPRAKPDYLNLVEINHVLYKPLKECLEDDPRRRPSSSQLQVRLETLLGTVLAPEACICAALSLVSVPHWPKEARYNERKLNF